MSRIDSKEGLMENFILQTTISTYNIPSKFDALGLASDLQFFVSDFSCCGALRGGVLSKSARLI
jgi:hypothetical protein